MKMEMKPVKSSYLKSMGYNAEKSELRIEFNSGAIFDYFDVTPGEYDSLANSESIGRHFSQNIKTQHSFKKFIPKEEGEK